MQDRLLEIKNLTVEFSSRGVTTTVVKNLSLSVRRGQTLGLVGESGSGKTVTGLSIMGLLPEQQCRFQGQISLASRDIDFKDQQQMKSLRGSEIAMVFQEPMTSLNPVLTLEQQMLEVLDPALTRNEAKEKIIQLFQEVDIDRARERLSAYPHELSGGQRQRVMIAMALAKHPKIIIADEPTTALDVTVQKQIIELLVGLQSKYGLSIIFISHDLALVGHMAHRIAVMKKGELVEEGSAKELLQNPQHPYTKALLNCRPQKHYQLRRLPVVSDFIGSSGQEKAFDIQGLGLKEKSSIQDDIVLSADNLSTYYAKSKNILGQVTQWHKAVDGVSFKVNRGQTLSIVGESGCGKSTLGRSLTRLCKIKSGRIYFNGLDIHQSDRQQDLQLRRKIQIIFQDPYSSLNPRLSIATTLTEPMKVHGLGANHKDRLERAVQLLEKVGLEADHLGRYPHQFSGGQRQRICIARALSVEPELIVCDEAVSALDVSVQAQVLNLLLDLQQDMRLTYIFISHDLSVVRFVSDEVLVMKDGQIVEAGSVEKIYNQPQHEYTKNLLASIPQISKGP